MHGNECCHGEVDVFLEVKESTASFDKRSGWVSIEDDGVLWVRILW